jgi:hypothetical protein
MPAVNSMPQLNEMQRSKAIFDTTLQIIERWQAGSSAVALEDVFEA